MEEIHQRRMPARPRKISDIRIGDERVRVVGLVVDKRDSEFTLDDGSGLLTVIFDDPAVASGIEIGAKVRVFGSPLLVSGAKELHADIVQRVDKLDLNLYREVRQEAERLERELGR
ncbi:MAG: hypothetical protein ACP5PX_02350 [Candidatus Hadarchaeum sp.]|uniref:hypothetical protein n=1 Tax=Candidatus Hadarchaeum sp. TaxID=2883567 RepID=UPI003D117FDB